MAVPSVVRLAELAEIFDCELEVLIAETSNRKLDQAQRIAEMLDGLTLEKREILVSVIKQMISSFSKEGRIPCMSSSRSESMAGSSRHPLRPFDTRAA